MAQAGAVDKGKGDFLSRQVGGKLRAGDLGAVQGCAFETRTAKIDSALDGP